MLTILHGDNIVLSREELVRIKNSAINKEIRDINGKDMSEAELRQGVESLSLFGSAILITLEHTFSTLGRKEKLIKIYADIINQAGQDTSIIIWEPKELGKTVLDCFKKAVVRVFKTPPVIFALLDGLAPGYPKQILMTYEKAESTEAPELMLYMIQNRVRQLIQVKDGVTPDRVSGWQLTRLTNQCRSFTMNELLTMETKLIDLEYFFKSGTTPYTLTQLIKQFIIHI